VTGKHIELFLVDGEPGGITTAEIAGWTGHVLTGPRKDVGEILRRPEAGRNGAYLLLGDDEEAVGGVTCYIGRTENFIHRFRDHKAKKDYWDRVVLITAKDDAFNEGHWGYLEARLVEKATRAQRVGLVNTQTPQGQAPFRGPGLRHGGVHGPPADHPSGARRQRDTAGSGPERRTDRRSRLRRRRSSGSRFPGPEWTRAPRSTVTSSRCSPDPRSFAAWAGAGTTESTRRAYAALKARYEKLVADRIDRDRGWARVA
jgi:hypothetical protein